MIKAGKFLAIAGFLLIAAFLALNWSSLMTAAPLDFGMVQVHAPLGIVMFGLTIILVAIFLVAYLRHQIGTLLEIRKLHKEVQRVQEEMQQMRTMADKAEASRVEALHKLIETEFRLINERLGTVGATTVPPASKHQESHLLSPPETSRRG